MTAQVALRPISAAAAAILAGRRPPDVAAAPDYPTKGWPRRSGAAPRSARTSSSARATTLWTRRGAPVKRVIRG